MEVVFSDFASIQDIFIIMKTQKINAQWYDYELVIVKNIMMMRKMKIESETLFNLIKIRSEIKVEIKKEVLREKIKNRNLNASTKKRYLLEAENQKRRTQAWIKFNNENKKSLPDAITKWK